MAEHPNRIRGETSVELGGVTYILRPEHGRAVKLDEALPKGVLGTLVDLTQKHVIKVPTLATIIFHLADDPPKQSDLERMIWQGNMSLISTSVAVVMSAISGGTDRREDGSVGGDRADQSERQIA